MQNDVRNHCPLFLLSGGTAGELETLLADLRGGGYTLLSLRELFRCRRGMRAWPKRPCAVLLRDFSFAALLPALPVLQRLETPVGLFCRAPYAREEAEVLRGCEWLCFFAEANDEANDAPASLLPDGGEFHVAAFCERADAHTASFFREHKVWMAVTLDPALLALPVAEDVLLAVSAEPGVRLPELLARYRAALLPQPQRVPFSLRLPLKDASPFSEPAIAFPFCLLCDCPERMERTAAAFEWTPVFDPSDGDYRPELTSPELLSEPIPPEDASAEGFCRLLQKGCYILLQTRALRTRFSSVELPLGSLLLFGCDGGDVFWGVTVLRPGVLGKASFHADTLRACCADPAGVLRRLTPVRAEEEPPCTPETARRWAEVGASSAGSADGVYRGWEASVAFANRVLSQGKTVSAASLRTFLEERMLFALRLRYFSRRERLDTQALDGYQAMLETEGAEALEALREKLWPDASSLLRIGELLQRLLNAETLCRCAFSEELERAERLKAFRKEKAAKNG